MLHELKRHVYNSISWHIVNNFVSNGTNDRSERAPARVIRCKRMTRCKRLVQDHPLVLCKYGWQSKRPTCRLTSRTDRLAGPMLVGVRVSFTIRADGINFRDVSAMSDNSQEAATNFFRYRNAERRQTVINGKQTGNPKVAGIATVFANVTRNGGSLYICARSRLAKFCLPSETKFNHSSFINLHGSRHARLSDPAVSLRYFFFHFCFYRQKITCTRWYVSLPIYFT